MRIHDPCLGDPLVEQPEPLTLFLPVVEASLQRRLDAIDPVTSGKDGRCLPAAPARW